MIIQVSMLILVIIVGEREVHVQHDVHLLYLLVDLAMFQRRLSLSSGNPNKVTVGAETFASRKFYEEKHSRNFWHKLSRMARLHAFHEE